jgi:hypothetical protein
MPKFQHEPASPNLPALIEILADHQIRYIIVGSVAAQLYGVDAQPCDFDIVPALDLGNLTRLAQVLQVIEATLPDSDEIGKWETQADGEKKWVSRKATPEELRQRAEWMPNPKDISSLDALFHTRFGNFDVVPDLAGDYLTLIQRAKKMTAHGRDVWVAHINELLARLTVPRRQKDIHRVRQLRELQRQLTD